MCLGTIARVRSIDGVTAVVEVAGGQMTADCSCAPGVKPGDFVMIHMGLVISIVDEREAQEMLRLAGEAR